MLASALEALGELTATEETLVRCFAEGRPAKFEPGEDENLPEARAKVLRWLLANGGDGDGSRVGGLRVTGLHVPDDEIDLDGVSVDFPVILEDCRLGRLLLTDARLITLKLTGTHCDGISGDRLRIAHGLLLDRGFTAYGATRLPSTRIGDDLNCLGGRFAAAAAGKSALLLDGSHIEGRLYLSGASAVSLLERSRDDPDPGEPPTRAGGVSAQGTRVGGNLLCIDSTFSVSSPEKSALNLEAAMVDGDGVFVRMAAGGDIKMRQARFNGTLIFRSASFEGKCDLRGASVGGDVDFGKSKRQPAKLGSKLNLAGAAVGGALQMGNADLSEVSNVDLSRTRLGYLDDRRVSWPSRATVQLEGFELGGIAVENSGNGGTDRRLAWLRAQNESWSPQPYSQVVGALRLAGEDDPARRIAIGLEQERRGKGGLRWISQVWNWLLDKTIAYGYRPYRAFIWAIVVILACAAVFAGCFGHVEFVPSDKPSHLYPLVYSLDAFLPIVDLGQAGSHTPKGLAPHIVLWVEICLGWLLTTLGVLGVTGVVRKE
jgi:hypothetical protein